MSVAYQSWEVTSGHSVGYNIAYQGKSNGCSLSDPLPSEASSYCGGMLGSSELFLRSMAGVSDISKGLFFPNSNVLIQQDTLTKGLSSLSLHPPHGCDVISNKIMDSTHAHSNESTIPRFATPLAEYRTQGRASGFSNFTGLAQTASVDAHEKKCVAVCSLYTTPSNNCCTAQNSEKIPCFGGFYSTPDSYCSFKHKLGVVTEEKTFDEDLTTMGVCNDLELDLLSSSSTDSISSIHDKPNDGGLSFSDGSCSVGEEEVQSEFRGLSSSSGGTVSPKKKGLSQFYAGKSRSFSCLADVVSIKDLAKPENSYVKKRKYNLGRSSYVRPQLPPLQKGTSSISKKLPHAGKATLALAVAMSVKEDVADFTHEINVKNCVNAQRQLGGTLSSRSHSLSDLQGAGGIYMPPS